MIFASGSCRLLTSIETRAIGHDLLHSLKRNFIGANFLGKYHNTKQHIQFIEWLLYKKELPMDICERFFTVNNDMSRNIKDNINYLKKREIIRNKFEQCDVFIFEICSIKVYECDGYQVQHELMESEKKGSCV